MSIHVNVDNFARAETDRMFHDLAAVAGGVNRWSHVRTPTPVEAQPVIRMNRDTLYSLAVVDVSDGATVTLPDAGDRYLSLMVVDRDHYVTLVAHGPGEVELSAEDHDADHVCLIVRTLVDPADADDVSEVNALQDQLALRARSAADLEMLPYDTDSMDATRAALLQLAAGVGGYDRTFGRAGDVDPVRHLLGTAAGWGGLPETEAFYLNVDPKRPVGEYDVHVGEVPVDAFWSISMYNRDGYFEANDLGAYNMNSLTAAKNDDGTVTVRFGTDPSRGSNYLPITEGWNYIVRLYRPHPEVLDGSWTFPEATPVD
jgi:hypothetical protein